MEEPRRRLRFDSFTFFVAFGFGSFVGVALSLLAIALVQRSDASDRGSPTEAFAVPTQPPTPFGATATPDARARTKTASDVYLGPGGAYAIVGLLARGEAVEVIGRDSNSEWVAVRFPPGSAARGWLPADSLDNLSRIESLAVVQPTPLPRNVVPPPPVFSGTAGGALARTPLPGQPEVVTPTPQPAAQEPAGPPDLVVTRLSLDSNGAVRVTIGNRGPGPLSQQQASVLVRDQASNQELVSGPRSLAAGETVTLTTQFFRVVSQADVTALVDPAGDIRDSDRSNNAMTVSLSAVGPTATPTPRRRED